VKPPEVLAGRERRDGTPPWPPFDNTRSRCWTALSLASSSALLAGGWPRGDSLAPWWSGWAEIDLEGGNSDCFDGCPPPRPGRARTPGLPTSRTSPRRALAAAPAERERGAAPSPGGPGMEVRKAETGASGVPPWCRDRADVPLRSAPGSWRDVFSSPDSRGLSIFDCPAG